MRIVEKGARVSYKSFIHGRFIKITKLPSLISRNLVIGF
jgi:hypothetical protein